MLHGLRRQYAQSVTSGAQLLLLFVGFKLDSRPGWLGVLSLMALISFFAWLSALYRLRTIRGTPTSKVASAAQGYVELIGRGHPLGDPPLISKLRALPCLWYRYKVEQSVSDNKWKTIDSGESVDSFILRDDSGDCVVDPEYAEIITKHRDCWLAGDYRYTEWKFIAHDTLYVLGEFRTRNPGSDFDSRAALNTLLAEWKRDMPALHQRFDLNNDGELDLDEWMLARQAAKREIAKQKRAIESQADIHLIAQPRDSKLFLISNLTPEKLSRRYLFWAWAHIAFFLAALWGLNWILGHSTL